MSTALWELLSYIVTVIALPVAVSFFILEQRKERANEEEAIWQQLSDAYIDFLKVVIDNADLQLRTKTAVSNLNAEQLERRRVIFDMLISLFERAYLLAYEEDMNEKQRRLWHSWEDYMREWCQREDFRRILPELVCGEDPDFAAYITRLAQDPSIQCSSESASSPV